MSEELDGLVDKLKETSQWVRILFMIAFALVLYLVMAPIILVLMLAQALFALVTGSSNKNLRVMGDVISQYVYQILRFVSYNDERKPFPFTDFPTAGEETETGADNTVDDESADSDTSSNKSSKKSVKKAPAKKQDKTKKASTAKKKTADRQVEQENPSAGAGDVGGQDAEEPGSADSDKDEPSA